VSQTPLPGLGADGGVPLLCTLLNPLLLHGAGLGLPQVLRAVGSGLLCPSGGRGLQSPHAASFASPPPLKVLFPSPITLNHTPPIPHPSVCSRESLHPWFLLPHHPPALSLCMAVPPCPHLTRRLSLGPSGTLTV
jgi:hypothetical protein